MRKEEKEEEREKVEKGKKTEVWKKAKVYGRGDEIRYEEETRKNKTVEMRGLSQLWSASLYVLY